MTPDYTAFTVDDFIADEYFHQWVCFPDTNSNAFWFGWIDSHPEKKETVAQAVHFIRSLRFQQSFLSSQQVIAALEQNFQKIAAAETAAKNKTKKMALITGSVAVAVLLVIASGLFLFPVPSLSLAITTGPAELRTIWLPDSTKVILNENSSIRYSGNMKEQREVWVDGEGFFDVAHKERPGSGLQNFIVHIGDLDIEVLGTTFNVKKAAGNTNVTLNTGSIRIGLHGEEATIVSMQPGDFVQYKTAEKKILKKQVRPHLYSVWKEEKIKLDAVPLYEIAQLLQDTYGYKVILEDSKIANSRVSGSGRLKQEQDFLDAIAFSLDINIVKKDSVLHFQSKEKNK